LFVEIKKLGRVFNLMTTPGPHETIFQSRVY